MPQTLESYAEGRWQAPSDEGVTVLDASTGEEVARVSSAGIDTRAMAAYARRVGGPELRAMSFPERANALKALAQYLNERRDAYYELSFRTGATLRDSRFDIDGGIGVLFSYSSMARREMPNGTMLVDGEAEASPRAGRSSANTFGRRGRVWPYR